MSVTFSEKAMVLRFCEDLEKKSTLFAVEVPFFHRSIDLVFVDRRGRYNAIEFKLKNWKQALTQAKDYMLGAEYTFICIPKNVFNNEVKRVVKEQGCGLIVYDDEKGIFKVVKKPKKNKCQGSFLLEKGFNYAHQNKNYHYLQTFTN